MYKVTIKESSKDLTLKQQIMYKETKNAEKVDTLLEDNSEIKLKVKDYVLLDIHNDDANGDKDYTTLVLIDENDMLYTTSSKTLIDKFLNFWCDLEECDEEWLLKIFRSPSNNHKGKYFLNCTIL